ncbi:MAG: hypothetical protein USCAAHI_00211 [Beijerinckiaceae bacterium]|nr:MAG: hypothetical protein USCAAHI_00211 [Beijerinckiaceae bacterium]
MRAVPADRVVVHAKRFPRGIELVAVVNHGYDRLYRQLQLSRNIAWQLSQPPEPDYRSDPVGAEVRGPIHAHARSRFWGLP